MKPFEGISKIKTNGFVVERFVRSIRVLLSNKLFSALKIALFAPDKSGIRGYKKTKN